MPRASRKPGLGKARPRPICPVFRGSRKGPAHVAHPDPARPERGERLGLSAPAPPGAGAPAPAGGAGRADHRRHGGGIPRAGDEPPADLLFSVRRRGGGRAGACPPSRDLRVEGPCRALRRRGRGRRAEGAAWAYPDPTPGFRPILGYVAFYAGPMEACFVGEARATPQPGGFYGGWITPASSAVQGRAGESGVVRSHSHLTARAAG